MHRGSCSAVVKAIAVVTALGLASAAHAQTKPASSAKPDPDKSKTTAALKAYDNGTRSFKSGKMDSAVKSLSDAIKSGGLSSQQMATALYTRGLAYRKLGKPALAISDLTTSVWLKNGLSEADRTKAVEARQAAYREAGLGDNAPPVTTPSAIQSAQASPVDEPANPQTSTAAKPAAGAAPSALSQVAAAPAQSWESTTTATSTPAPASVTVDNKNAIEQASSSVTGFFGSLFGSSSGEQSSSAATPPPTSPTATPPAASQQAAQSAPALSVASTPASGPVNSLHAAVAPTGGSPRPTPAATAPAAPAPQPSVSGFTTTTVSSPQPAATLAPAAPVASTSVPETQPPAPAAVPVASTPSGAAYVSTAAPPAVSTPAYAPSQGTPSATPTPPPPTPTADESPNTLEEAGTAVSNFFGNLFGGVESSGAAATQSPSSNVATSSTGGTAGPTSAVSSWSQGTEVTAANKPRQTASAAPPTQVAALAPQAAPSGNYRLQVAAVRSRDDAARLAAQIKKDHGFRLGGQQAEIDKAVIGNMGTFYRVRIGPYANASEPKKLCKVLRPHGYDCLVVTQ